jgi:MerT mercuric transport protein
MKKGSAAQWSDVGALTTAGTVAATILCCLPFATGVVGAALAAFGSRLMPLQPLLIGLSLSSLAYSFYQAYRPAATCSADTCDVPTALRRRRVALWVVTFAVFAMLTANWWANWAIYWSL